MNLRRARIALYFAAILSLLPGCAANLPRAGDGSAWLIMLPLPENAHIAQDSESYERLLRTGPPAPVRRSAVILLRDYDLRLRAHWPMPPAQVYCLVVDGPDVPTQRLLEADARVAWIQPNQTFTLMSQQARSADPYHDLQHAHKTLGLEPHRPLGNGRGVRLAVIDTSVDAEHPDLIGRVRDRHNFLDDEPSAPEMHGTAIAGVIAATAGNGSGVAGVAPEAEIASLRACRAAGADAAGGECTSLSLGRALTHTIANNIPIVNLSLGGPPDRLVTRLIESAQSRGIAVVAAALSADAYPAHLPGVVAVHAQDLKTESVAPSAFAAPGRDILTTVPGGRYDFLSGHSFAAAHVSGLLALVFEQLPHAESAELTSVLRASTDAGGILNAQAMSVRLRASVAARELPTSTNAAPP